MNKNPVYLIINRTAAVAGAAPAPVLHKYMREHGLDADTYIHSMGITKNQHTLQALKGYMRDIYGARPQHFIWINELQRDDAGSIVVRDDEYENEVREIFRRDVDAGDIASYIECNALAIGEEINPERRDRLYLQVLQEVNQGAVGEFKKWDSFHANMLQRPSRESMIVKHYSDIPERGKLSCEFRISVLEYLKRTALQYES